MAVPVSTQQGLTLGQPQPLFESPDFGAARGFDVGADGQRFLTIAIAPVQDSDREAEPPKIRVVENWYEEFRDRKLD
jgi:hypothetical protein